MWAVLPAIFMIHCCFVSKVDALPAEVQSQVDAGRQVFAASCAACHGAAGRGALGPALADRNPTLDLIRQTISNGRVGSVMPAFEDTLDSTSLAQVAAYVQWLATAGTQPQAPVPTDPPPGQDGTSSQPVAVGGALGVPARGAVLFFNAGSTCSCRSCHSFAQRGGPVGPDLMHMNKPPVAVYQDLVSPAKAAPGFEARSITSRDGNVVVGIKSAESDASIAVFDVSSCPPVKRTVARSEVARVSEMADRALYNHAALSLSKQDLIDLSAYLGKAASPSAAQ